MHFLEDQYEAHLEQFDTLAEFIRGPWIIIMPMCARGLA
jgi:hypothetical protein